MRIAARSNIAYVRGVPQAYYRVHAASMQRTQFRNKTADLAQRRLMFDPFVAHHQWERTLRPLADFCAKPAIDTRKSEFAASMHVPQHPPTILQRIRRRIAR